jgi:hypothetical protein
MAFTNIVCKQLDVLTMVAVHRWHRLVGHTAKRMRGLGSPSCFVYAAASLTATVFQWSWRLTSGRWLT